MQGLSPRENAVRIRGPTTSTGTPLGGAGGGVAIHRKGRKVRAGYRRETGRFGEHLIAPSGEVVALEAYKGAALVLASQIEGIESREVTNKTETREAFEAMAEEHYQLTTTPWQRFHDRRKELLGDPICGWLAFVVAAAVAVVGWLG